MDVKQETNAHRDVESFADATQDPKDDQFRQFIDSTDKIVNVLKKTNVKQETDAQLELMRALQLKKTEVRTELAKKGMLKRDGYNMGQKFSYFTEAQYKVIFNHLFSKYGLEFSVSVSNIEFLDHASAFGKPQNGYVATLKVCLYDISTGYHEESFWPGVGFDISDKAIYKAYTGAVKAYFNNTFLVASGEDPDRDQAQTTRPMLTTKPTNMTKERNLK